MGWDDLTQHLGDFELDDLTEILMTRLEHHIRVDDDDDDDGDDDDDDASLRVAKQQAVDEQENSPLLKI